MPNTVSSKASASRVGHAPTNGSPARTPTTHRTAQPPNSPAFVPEQQRSEYGIDADLIESILLDAETRVNLFLDNSEPSILPLSRKVFQEAVTCGLLKLVRDPAGRVVQVVNGHMDPYQSLSTENINAHFGFGPDGFGPDAQSDDYTTGSSAYSPVTSSGDPGSWSFGDSDADVDWAAVFSSCSDGLSLAERGETTQTTWAALDSDGADGAANTFVQGPGPASCRYGGGNAVAEL